MTSAFESLRAANREIVAGLDAREQELLAREKALAAEMENVVAERRGVVSDRETIKKAEAIQARVLGLAPSPSASSAGSPGGSSAATAEADAAAYLARARTAAVAAAKEQSRARIGPQRYAMLATLRERGRLSPEEIARYTWLSLNRVKEQLRADSPAYVIQETFLGKVDSPDGEYKYRLTDAGTDLLQRFENYRKSQGKPLPSLAPGDNAADDEEVDPAHSKSVEAGVQGPLSAAVKPVGEVVHDNMT